MNSIASKQEYEEIETLVFSYQNGDLSAGEKLIEIFNPYMIKYLRLIKDGFVNLKDKDTRRFIGLFMNDCEAKKKLNKSLQSSETRNKAHIAVSMIGSLCKDLPEEDIMQELIVILLMVAKRYKKKSPKVNFCGYLYNIYKYELYRRINQMTSDPIVRSDLNLSYDDDSYVMEEDIYENEPTIYTSEPLMVFDEDLGNSWIRGITCSELFEILDPTQRLILRLSYYDNLSDIEIGQKMGIHRNTVRAQRNNAVDIIRKNLGDSGEDY